MPLVQVTMIEGRSAELTRELIAQLTEAVVRTLEVPLASVRVIVSEVAPDHWGVGGVTKSETGASG